MAFLEIEDLVHGDCGHSWADSTTAGRPEEAFEAEPVTCKACAVKERAAAIRAEEMKGGDYGIRWVVRKK